MSDQKEFVSYQHIIALGRTNPLVNRLLRLQLESNLSNETTLCAMVLALSGAMENLKGSLIDELNSRPAAFRVGPSA
jgi:20S proteasome alpha/beta subunit